MKKDGFVSTAMAYTFLIVFAFLLLTIIKSYNNNITLSDEIKNKAKDDIINSYTYFSPGSCTTYTVPSQGNYRIELWGADGGSANSGSIQGGHGAYTAGTIYLDAEETLYFCVGKKGTVTAGGYNGGGNGASYSAGGGGATDVRFGSNNVNARIMVAGGGGGASYSSATANGVGGNAGGLNGTRGFKGKTLPSTDCAAAGSQTGGGNFGSGKPGSSNAAGGGGGYRGGNGSSSTSCGGAGGSSYISGHKGSIAIISSSSTSPRTAQINGSTVTCNTTNASSNIDCSVHYSEKYFVDTKMGYADPEKNKTTIPIPVYGTSSNASYGDGSARIYKVE